MRLWGHRGLGMWARNAPIMEVLLGPDPPFMILKDSPAYCRTILQDHGEVGEQARAGCAGRAAVGLRGRYWPGGFCASGLMCPEARSHSPK